MLFIDHGFIQNLYIIHGVPKNAPSMFCGIATSALIIVTNDYLIVLIHRQLTYRFT